MDALIFDGYVTLNAEGKQYTASFHLGWGVITVTSGSVSRVLQLGQAAVAPQSVARTILRKIVTECPHDVEVKQPDDEIHRAQTNHRQHRHEAVVFTLTGVHPLS